MDNEVKVKIVLIGQDKFKAETSKALNGLQGDANQTKASLGKMGVTGKASFGAIAGAAAIAGTAVVAGMSAIIKNGIRVTASLETTEAGFKTLLGSAEKAAEAISMVKADALKTPFDTVQLARLNQMLTGVTKNAQKSEKFLLDVGEAVVAMGRGTEEMDRIIVNLQQIGATGRASMVDIRQFAFAGIPIFEMLKKETGLSGKALDKFISDGKVSFEMLQTMFDKANNKGGQFFEGYKNNANTFTQKSQELSESWDVFTSEFVKKTGVIDIAKGAVSGLTNAMSTKGGLGDQLTRLFALMKSETAIKIFKKGLDALTASVGFLADYTEAYMYLVGGGKDKSFLTDKGKKGAKNFDQVKAEVGEQAARDIFNKKGTKTVNSLFQSKGSSALDILKKPFATGGIIGGSSYSGDKVLARVNSGEMILNGGQQNALFNLLKGLGNRPNINFNGAVNMGSNAAPVQQQSNFVNMLKTLS